MSAQTPTINGLQALWGMDGSVYSVATGTIEDFDGEDMSDEGVILDNNGYVITDNTYNENSEFTMTILMQTGFTKPAIGALVTVDSVANCIVKRTGRVYGKKDWRKFKLTVKNWVNLVPAS